jgi:CHAT domain-containing protein/tetratricopeptide (TPR) repeat protein
MRTAAEEVRRACANRQPWPAEAAADRLRRDTEELMPPGSSEWTDNLELVARIYRATFRYAEAEELFRKALPIRRERVKSVATAEERERMAFVLWQLGTLEAGKWRVSVALSLLEEALRILPPPGSGNDLLRANLLESLAWHLTFSGDLDRAIGLFKEALDCAHTLKPADPELVSAIQDRFANALLSRAARLNIREDTREAVGKDAAEAVKLLKEAGRYYSEKETLTRSDGISYMKILVSMAKVLCFQKKWKLAEGHLEVILKRMGPKMNESLRVSYLYYLAVAKSELGKSEEAERLCAEILGTLEKPGFFGGPDKSEVLCFKAQVLGLLGGGGRKEEAIELARKALLGKLSLLDNWFDYQTDAQRLLLISASRQALNTYLTLASEAGLLSPDRDCTAIYRGVLAWKGAGLTRSLVDRLTASEPDACKAKAKREECRQAAAAYREWKAGIPLEGVQAEWLARGETLRAKKEELEKEWAATPRMGRGANEPLTPDGLAEALPDKTVLVDFVAYDHQDWSRPGKVGMVSQPRFLAFLSRKGWAPVCVPLAAPLPEIEQTLQQWMGALPKRDDSVRGPAQALARAVWEPVAKQHQMQSVTRVVLCPDNVLWLVPFAALPGSEPRRYLVEELELSHVLSPGQARDLFCRQGNYNAPAGEGCLVVGAIEYGGGAKKGLPDVPDGEGWVNEVVGSWAAAYPEREPKVIRGPGAKADVVLQEFAQGYREIHLLGHGPVLSKMNPRGSGLNLEDVRMPLALANLDLPSGGANTPDVEELSLLNLRGVQAFWWWGCGVNSGSVLSGEAVFGIPRALHMAGCQTVLSSLWEAKGVTRDFSLKLPELSRNKGCTTVSQALREVQREQCAGDRGVAGHPYYWAQWIVIGDTSLGAQHQTGGSTSASTSWEVLTATLAGLVLLGGLLWRMRWVRKGPDHGDPVPAVSPDAVGAASETLPARGDVTA